MSRLWRTHGHTNSGKKCSIQLELNPQKHPATSLQALLLDVPRKVSGYKPLSLTSPFQFCSTQKNGLQYYKTVPHIINHVSFHLLSTTERESTGLGASYKWDILQRYAQNQVTLLTTLHLLAELTNQSWKIDEIEIACKDISSREFLRFPVLLPEWPFPK